MKEYILNSDKYQMNWIEEGSEWGKTVAPAGIEVTTASDRTGDVTYETYTFKNVTAAPIDLKTTDLGIYTPFADDYKDHSACITRRCHAHVWCGENVSYVCALRMGSEAPHLGLVLTEGSLSAYSIDRDMQEWSNSRGDIILHPTPQTLAPGEALTIKWTIFPHGGKDDFFARAREHAPRFITINAPQLVFYEGEHIHIEAVPSWDASKTVVIDETADADYGDKTYTFEIDGTKTHARIFITPVLNELARARCHFIAEHQQYDAAKADADLPTAYSYNWPLLENSLEYGHYQVDVVKEATAHEGDEHLDGAYLPYDNEINKMYYSFKWPDHNAARERIGMGLLIARYLIKVKDGEAEDPQAPALEVSLKKYAAYIDREIVDPETAFVYDDYIHLRESNRLYNYPWVAEFHLDLYRLWGGRDLVEKAYRVLKAYYRYGGEKFYGFVMPFTAFIKAAEKEGMTEIRDEMMQLFTAQAEQFLNNGLLFPKSEVNFEQGIVAPTIMVYSQMYELTGDEKYLKSAEEMLPVMDGFQGIQPDHHLYEVAIRHWDGFWFGKRMMYGDTLPHYWSALSAVAFDMYAKVSGSEKYARKADAIYRGVLSMFRPDGRATCACMFPETINGRPGNYDDPLANDQDWGMYFALR